MEGIHTKLGRLVIPIAAIAAVVVLGAVAPSLVTNAVLASEPASQGTPTPTATPTPEPTPEPAPTPTPTVPTAPSDGDAGEAQPGGLFSEVEGDPPPSPDIETLASRFVGIDFGQLSRVTKPPDDPKARATGKTATPQTLVLNLFDDVAFTGIVEHVEPTSSGHVLWGRLDGVELGTMTLVVNGSVVTGTVRTPDAVYTIRTAGDGAYIIRQIDESSLPPLGEPLRGPLPTPNPSQGVDPTATSAPNGTSTPTPTPTPTVPTAPSDGDAGKARPGGLFSEGEGDPPPSPDVETLASRLVEIDFGQLARVTKPPDGSKTRTVGKTATLQTLVLNLFDDVVFTGIVEHVEPTSSGRVLWGRLDGVELGTMTLVVNGSVVAGTVRTLEAVYTIRTAGDGAYVIRQIDESSLPPLGEPLRAPLPAPDARAQAANDPLDDGSEIDVMVVYTPAAKYREGSRAAIEALIDLFVAETNQANANSGVTHRIRLVLREEVEYTEDGNSFIDLRRLRDDTDGYMDHVHELRDLYAADLVHIVVGRSVNVCGVASTEFALTASYCGGLVFAHELGHNMGLSHDRYVVANPGRRSNFGYVNQRMFDEGAPESARWRTIMAYGRQCGEVLDYHCQQLPYFSNPDKTYNGDPMGVPTDHPSTGVDGPADAVGTLNDRREIIANYRRSSTDPTPRVDLTLSPYWLSETGGVSTVTATLHRPSSADTMVTVSASPADAVTLSANRTLTILAGQTVSAGAVTITSVDNGDQTGDVSVTVSGAAANTGSQGVIAPEPVELAIADDETTPVVTLSLSPVEIFEGRDWPDNRTVVTATLDNRSNAETTVTISASPAEAVEEVWWNPRTIPAGQVTSIAGAIFAVDDIEFTESKKSVTVSGTATNPQGVTEPESVTLTIIDDDAPIFADDGIAYTFTAGVAASRVLPEAEYGNGMLTYSISPALSNGVTFIPGPPARMGVSTTSTAVSETSYTLTATDADGDTDTMTVSITVRKPVCADSAAVSGYTAPELVADCEALLASRDTLRGDQSLNWSEHLSIDNWQGVEIADNRVVGVGVSSLDLTGSIPSELGNLTNLQSLNLRRSELTGTIPSELGNLTNLQSLGLYGNRLTGTIPSELGNLANLQSLNLGRNELTGPIPAELGNLANLQELHLSGNELTGEMPAELGNLANLQELNLHANQLTGPIPAELAGLANLQSLDLDGNQLTGEMPAELGSLANLQSLVLGWNELTGKIPSELGNLANLRSLVLSGNELTGPVPVELGSLTNLQSLVLGWNELTGEIPVELGSLANLEWLDLGWNELTGPIPAELGSLANLEWLDLNGNELTGPIPAELGSLANLRELYLSQNQLTGNTPPELGSLSNLQWLSLGANRLTGKIPSELGNLANLRSLVLSENRLEEEIPSELGDLANLEELFLSHNWLTGEIPTDLGNLANLQSLYLSGNQLTGCIPARLRDVPDNDLASLSLPFCEASQDACVTEGAVTDATNTGLVSDCETLLEARDTLAGSGSLNWSEDTPITEWDGITVGGTPQRVTDLDLNDRGLTGRIPAELGNLSNLQELDLSENQLSGLIPSKLGGLPNLVELILWGNELNGSIPAELGSLANLRLLWLGDNQLSGPIPQELGRLVNLEGLWLSANQLSEEIPAELGSLTNLQALDLSYNQLTGPIPVWLGYLSNLHRLELSSNQLAGPIPPELGYLSYLTRLYLSENQLTGCIPAGLRHVTNNDLDQLGLPFCDVSPQRGGELRLAVPYDLFDGRFSPFDEQRKREAAQVNSLIFSRLMRRSASGVVPDLAVSWEANDDGTEWIVNLRQDASFHDGRPVAAADVLYSIEAMNARFTALPHLANLELIDDVTLRVDFAEPSWDFPLRMTGASSVIVPEGMLEAGVDDFTQLVGSGPFRPVDYRVGELLTLERNPDYYETGLPHLDGIRIFVIPDRATRAAAFRVGELDYLGYPYGGLPVLTVDEADRASEARPDVVFAPYPIVPALWFDTQSAPFNDPRVRLAVLRAINDATLMQFSELGKSEPQSSIPRAIFPTWTTFLDDPSAVEEWRRHDPDMSRRLLAEAGYPDGFDTVMRIPENLPLYWDSSVAEVVSEMLKRVDISVALERVPYSEHRTAPADRGIKLMWVLPFGGNAEAFLIEHFTAGGTFNYSRTDIVIPDLDPDRPDSIIPVQQYLAEEVFYIPLPAPLYARSGRVRGPLLEGFRLSDLGTALSRVWLDLSASASCATGGAVADATNTGLVSDCETLLEARDTLAGSGSLNWSEDTPITEWDGIGDDSLEGSPQRVTRLYLNRLRLDGSIPSELSGLTALKVLHLHDNELTGPIPPELGSLSGLIYLYLHNNDLIGKIPSELGKLTSLKRLYLHSNDLTGSIPAALGSLIKLTHFWVADNDLTGPIPSELGNMASLDWLNLGQNNIAGTLPPELGKLARLRRLYVYENDLTGPIPGELGNLSRLTHIVAQGNDLSGEIPSELGNLSNLVWMGLYDNDLTGEIPPELGRLAKLQRLYLHRNELFGPVPPELGNLSALTNLWLSRNYLSGQLPQSLGGLTNLTRLRLGGNDFTGCLPAGLADVRNSDADSLGLPTCASP